VASPTKPGSSSDPSKDTAAATPLWSGPMFMAAVVASCLAALAAGLYLGGVATAEAIPGLPDAGLLTRWGLPVSKAMMNLSAAFTIGLLLLAVVLTPLRDGRPAPSARHSLQAATWSALVWAAATVATLVFQLSDILGLPPAQVVGDELTSYAGSTSQGTALMVVLLVAVAVALLGRTVDSAGAVLGLLGLSLVGLLPPPLTGHSASSPNHELAVTGISLHVVAISVWIGGLAALCYHALRTRDTTLHLSAARFSVVALWAYVGVGISGIASALANLPTLASLVDSDYGRMILIKSVAFLALGYVGWLHRSRVLPRIADGVRGAFTRLATGEVALMAAVLGFSVALSRTNPPDFDLPYDPVRELLGFPLPPPLSAQSLLVLWRPDLFYALLVVVLGALYAAGVVRLRRRGDRWPWGRTIAWFAGLLTIVAVKLTGVGTYAMVLFSVHMIQHMVLSMLTPILLVLGGPATLALRALRPAAMRGDRGPREWLVVLLNSKVAHFLTHPGFVVPMFVASTYALYFTPLFGALMNSMAGHMFMSLHFIIVGYLFYWLLIGVDPLPRPLPFYFRILILLLTMALHAFFGVGIMSLVDPIAMEWYGAFDVHWLDSVLDDQQTGGGIAWGMGEVPTVMVLFALLWQWIRDDERTERRRQRHSRRGGSDDADLDAYNAYLARLDQQAKRRGEE
jgi:cytochrome c oxidase assembly factor CtaG/putative copper export protein